MKRVVIFLSFCLLFTVQADAQKWLNKLGNAAKEAAKNTVERRVEQKAEDVTEEALDKAEDSVSKKEKKEKSQSENEEEAVVKEDSDDTSLNDKNSDAASTPQEPAQKLSATSRYDFVPGDQILFFEDFSQDAIGDFPALWSSNGSEIGRASCRERV